MSLPSDLTLRGGKHVQNPRVVATLLIANAHNATMQDSELVYSSLLR